MTSSKFEKLKLRENSIIWYELLWTLAEITWQIAEFSTEWWMKECQMLIQNWLTSFIPRN